MRNYIHYYRIVLPNQLQGQVDGKGVIIVKLLYIIIISIYNEDLWQQLDTLVNVPKGVVFQYRSLHDSKLDHEAEDSEEFCSTNSTVIVLYYSLSL